LEKKLEHFKIDKFNLKIKTMSIEKGKRILEIEAEAVRELAHRLGEEFVQAVDLLSACQGKLIVTGMGKSGLVAQKIAGTFSSTGTPAFFLHSAEAHHGDLGVISRHDIVIAVSNSGETEDLIRLIPFFKRMGIKMIALVGNMESTLARAADVSIDVSVKEEACPYNLVPTASTTAMMAMGDALALALLERKGFSQDDFARLHPAGALGRKLLLRVSDLMHTGREIPKVSPEASMKEVIIEMSSKMLGHAAVVDKGKLLGIISDGDLRRAMEKYPDVFQKRARDIMSESPKTIPPETLAAAALQKMESHSITSLLVCDDEAGENLIGIIHLHDLLKAGVV
jgi:arabinose-5-phosphate isomerase